MRRTSLLRNTRKTETGASIVPRQLVDRTGPFALLWIAMAAAATIGPAFADPTIPLSGTSGSVLLPGAGGTGLNSSAPGFVYDVPTSHYGTGSFAGTFPGASSPWQGTFTGTGELPRSGFAGTANFYFSGLTAGYLPAGSYLRLGDVDISEDIYFSAYNTAGNIILTHWLANAAFVAGSTPSHFQQSNLPTWDFAAGVYHFRGAPPNTLLTISMPIVQNVGRIETNRPNYNAGMSIAAGTSVLTPTPEPETFGMLGAAAGALFLFKRHRKSA